MEAMNLHVLHRGWYVHQLTFNVRMVVSAYDRVSGAMDITTVMTVLMNSTAVAVLASSNVPTASVYQL
jgi:hypothetical protein